MSEVPLYTQVLAIVALVAAVIGQIAVTQAAQDANNVVKRTSETRNLHPETRNAGTRNPKPETRNLDDPESETRNPKPQTPNPQPATLHQVPEMNLASEVPAPKT